MSTSLWAGVVTIALLGAGVPRPPFQQKPAREHLIDLTVAPAAATGPAAPGIHQLTLRVPIGGEAHEPRKPPPIRLSAPELERPDYRIGDLFEFEVVFQNIGDVPIAFPTMPDGSAVDRDMPGAGLAAVALTFNDEILGGQIVGLQTLYGATEIEGSLISVQPGERLRIRARSTWNLSSATGTPYEPHWPRPLKVKALVRLVGNGVLRMSEQSTGVTAVQFGTRQK
jgi:hypothetical protein